MAKPKAALSVIPKPGDHPTLRMMKAAVDGQLRKLLDEGISSKTLGTIERFCHSQREALMAVEKPDVLVRGRFGGNYGSSYAMVGPQIMSDETGAEESYQGQIPLAGAPVAETYGANALREFTAAIAKMQEKKPSITDLITALHDAKEYGLDDVAATISKQIDDLCGKKASAK